MEDQPADVRSALHVYELESEYFYDLELPPVAPGTVEVFVDGRRVTVIGGIEPDPEFFGKTARSYTAFRRDITLPDDVDLDRVEAGLVGTSLELHAPRFAPHHPRRLPLRTPVTA